MCGIAGIIARGEVDLRDAEPQARLLARALHHRGPDGRGFHFGPRLGALNCRLAIVDIAGGEQPIYNEAKTIGIVFNGEIYNYEKWRRRLLERGYVFKTRTDTEVILHLYQEFGEQAFQELEGMFAFCLWDERNGTIYIARDRFGMKPLYYYEQADRLVFASEIGAIEAVCDADIALDPDGIRDYLTFRYITGTNTIFRGVKRLAPGSYLRIRDGAPVTCRCYDDLVRRSGDFILDFEEAKRELRSLLHNSVQSHLIGEAPIAILLSGGVDSSIVAAILKALGVRLEAFNVGFPSVNEFQFSSAVAKACNFKLHNIEIAPSALIARMDEIILALDEPLADPACWPLYLLCEHIRPFAKVVLSGEGADELFGGYPQYRRCLPAGAGSLFDDFNRQSFYFLDGCEWLLEPEGASRWRRFEKYFVGKTRLAAMSVYDFKTWVPEDLMMKADKTLMRHSLEGRFPFLNRELYDFSQRLPDDFKISPQGTTKHILKEAFKDLIPEVVINRPKMGFTVPIAEILREAKAAVLDSLDMVRDAELGSILNMDKVGGAFERWYATAEGDVIRLWALFILIRWVAVKAQSRQQLEPALRETVLVANRA